MVLINLAFGAKLTYIFGIINVISILLVFFSCRCLAGAKIVNRLLRYGWYRQFYKNHCHYWWIFIVSVLLHTLLAFYMFGNPFN